MEDEFEDERQMLHTAALLEKYASDAILRKIDSRAEALEDAGKERELLDLFDSLPDCRAKQYILMLVQRMNDLLH